MTRRILAIVIAFVASIAGHLLVFTGGIELAMQSMQFRGGPMNPLAVVAVVAGLMLIAIAALTVAISSAGVIALGALHIVFSLLMVLLPVSMEFRPPTYQFSILLRDLNPAWGDGVLFSFILGTGMLTGVVLLVAGLAARARTMHANVVAIVVSIVVSILGLVGVFIAITGGYSVYRSMLQQLRGQVDVIGVALLLLGSVLMAAAVVTARWSSAGIVVLGVVVVLIGLVWSLAMQSLLGVVSNFSHDLVSTLTIVGPSGLLATVGVALIGVGVGSSVRARRAAAASTVLAPGEPAPVV